MKEQSNDINEKFEGMMDEESSQMMHLSIKSIYSFGAQSDHEIPEDFKDENEGFLSEKCCSAIE